MQKLSLPPRFSNAPRALRVLDVALWLAIPLLTFFTIMVAVFWIALPLVDGRPMYTQGWTTSVVVEHAAPDGDLTRHNLADRVSRQAEIDQPGTYVNFLSANVQARVFDFGPKLVLVVAAIADVALAWAALISLRGITRSSLQGDVFTDANATRLARLGAIAIIYPIVVVFIGRSIFNSVVSDDQLGVSGFWVRDGVDNGILWIGVGLLLLTLSRAFRWGVELQELEAATI